MTRRAAAALLLGAAALLAAACGGGPPPAPEASRPVRAALYKEPQSFSLVGNTDYNGEILARLVTDSLVQYDASLRIVPRVAESWTLSPDGRVARFTLREGVRWQDGAPVTADDVVFTVEKIRDPAVRAQNWASGLAELVTLRAEGPRTVVAEFARANADWLDGWIFPLVPAHLAGRDADLLEGAFARAPVGCGPFRIVRRTPGSEIVLEAHPGAWDGAPSLPGLVLRIVPDDRTAMQALLTGDLDLAVLPPDLYREARADPRSARLADGLYYGMRLLYLGWNQAPGVPYFRDAGVRRALLQALDREGFVRKVLGPGLARVAVSTYHPQGPWSDGALAPWPYDPAAASQALDEAGWTDADGDGVREKDGRPFAFTLMITAGSQALSDQVAAWVQQSLREVGVRVALEKLEWQVFQKRRKERRYDAALATFVLSPTADQTEIYDSGAADRFNYVSFSDPEVDRLLAEGRTTLDPRARRPVYEALQRRLHDRQPIGPLFHLASPLLLDRRLQGVSTSPFDLFRFVPGPRTWHWAGSPPER